MSFGRFTYWTIWASIIGSLLSGCTAVDAYSFRSIDYNLEAEQTQNQVLLLNIARSYLHRPMQFTELQSLVGTNSATGNLSFGFPVGPHPASAITTGTAGGSLSGSTVFTVPVLDTQDFYEGLLKPIPSLLVGYYFQSPRPKYLIFNLIFERAVVSRIDSECKNTPHASECERDFRNNPETDLEDVALFQTLSNYLLSLQISAEPIKPKKQHETIHAGAATININASSGANGSNSSETESKQPQQYRLCFSPREPDAEQEIAKTMMCAPSLESSSEEREIGATTTFGITFTDRLTQSMLNVIDHLPADTYKYRASILAFSGHKVSVALQLRSTAAIFNYLGQLISSEQGSGQVIGLYRKSFHQPLTPCWIASTEEAECKPIFTVQADNIHPSLVTVAYAGSVFSVPGDPNISFSPDVLSLLKELLALNSSAKSLPTTAVLSVVP